MNKIIWLIIFFLFIILIEGYWIIKYKNQIDYNNIVIKSINTYITKNALDNEKIVKIEDDYKKLNSYKNTKNNLSIFEIKILLEYIIGDKLLNTTISNNSNTIIYRTNNFDSIIKIKKNIELFKKKWFITNISNNKINNENNTYETIFSLETENVRNFLRTLIENNKKLKVFYEIIK